MRGSGLDDSLEWAMSERRERAVMRDVDLPPKKAPPEDFKLPTPRGVLSKAEIEALLRPQLPTINDDEAPVSEADEPVERPLEDLPQVQPEEARRMAARLSLTLAQMSGLKTAVQARSQARFHGFRNTQTGRSNAPGAAFLCFSAAGQDVTHLLHVPPNLADALITQTCGGVPRSLDGRGHRELSAIDCALIAQLAAPLRSLFGGEDVQLTGVETGVDYAAALLPADTGEEFLFDVRFAGQSAVMSLIRLPHQVRAESQNETGEPRRKPVTALLTARIATLSVPVSRLSGLKPGDTLLLGVPADQPVELLSGGRDGAPAFEGEIGRKGGQMAVRVRRAVMN